MEKSLIWQWIEDQDPPFSSLPAWTENLTAVLGFGFMLGLLMWIIGPNFLNMLGVAAVLLLLAWPLYGLSRLAKKATQGDAIRSIQIWSNGIKYDLHEYYVFYDVSRIDLHTLKIGNMWYHYGEGWSRVPAIEFRTPGMEEMVRLPLVALGGKRIRELKSALQEFKCLNNAGELSA